MRYKKILVSMILCILNINIFGFSPRYRDEFYLENRTHLTIVVSFEPSELWGHYSRYAYDSENYLLLSFNGGRLGTNKYFRTIRRRKKYQIGFCQYDYQNFNERSPQEKFSSFFKSILVYDNNDNLLYRIEDFSKLKIEDRTKSGPSLYVMIIE